MTNQATKIAVNLEGIPVKAAIDMESPFNEYYNEYIVMMKEAREHIEVNMWLPTKTEVNEYEAAVIDVYGTTYYVNKDDGNLSINEIDRNIFEDVARCFNVVYK